MCLSKYYGACLRIMGPCLRLIGACLRLIGLFLMFISACVRLGACLWPVCACPSFMGTCLRFRFFRLWQWLLYEAVLFFLSKSHQVSSAGYYKVTGTHHKRKDKEIFQQNLCKKENFLLRNYNNSIQKKKIKNENQNIVTYIQS